MPNKLPYSTSFTALGLEPMQFLEVCRVLEESGSSDSVLKDLTESVRSSTHNRKMREYSKRWEALSQEEKDILFTGDSIEVRGIAYLSVVKTYRLIGRFVIEGVLPLFYSSNTEITHKHYDDYFNKVAIEYPAMRNMSDRTYKNSRNRVFKILKDAGIITGNKTMSVSSFYPGARLVQHLNKEHPHYLKFFLLK